MSTTQRQADRLPSLDLLRSIAILWVMIFHLRRWVAFGGVFDPLSQLGWMGVDLFFVLSGYLIGSQLLRTYAQGTAPSFGDFYLRRALRVLPAYLAVLVLYFFWSDFREAKGIAPWWTLLTFTTNFQIDYATQRAFSHVWSLCVEEHFYLLLPAICWILMRRPSFRLTALVFGGLFALGIGLRSGIWLSYLQGDAPISDPVFVEKIYYPSYNRLDGLMFGVALASIRYFRPSWWQALMRRGNTLFAVSMALLVAACFVCFERVDFIAVSIGFPLLSLALAGLLAACVSDNCRIARWRIPGTSIIARLAFCLYLTHKAIYHLDQIWFGDLLKSTPWTGALIYPVTTLLAAGALHGLIEQPFLRLRDRWAQQKLGASRVVGHAKSSP